MSVFVCLRGYAVPYSQMSHTRRACEPFTCGHQSFRPCHISFFNSLIAFPVASIWLLTLSHFCYNSSTHIAFFVPALYRCRPLFCTCRKVLQCHSCYFRHYYGLVFSNACYLNRSLSHVIYAHTHTYTLRILSRCTGIYIQRKYIYPTIFICVPLHTVQSS